MRRLSRACVAAAALAAGTVSLADETYKCKDAAGRITYSGKECKLMGLTSAGEVKGQASVVSVPKVQPPAPSPARAAPPAPAAKGPPAEPKRRCFAVKGGGTRCNDEPEKTE